MVFCRHSEPAQGVFIAALATGTMIARLLHTSRLVLPILIGAMTGVGCSELSTVKKSTMPAARSSPSKSSASPSVSPQIIATEIASLGISQHTIALQDPAIAAYETTDWDDHDKNLILGKGIAILVFRHAAGEVPAVVRVLEAKPPLAHYWSHSVEGWLVTSSGFLEWSNEGDDKHAIKLAPGSYRLRVSIVENGSVDYDGSVGDDHALIELWPTVLPSGIQQS